MKAMIFAAGLGTRLRPLTDTLPKALVPLCGKPLLYHVARRLISAGFDDIVINVHHFADKIEDYLKSENNFGVRMSVSDERDLLRDTGGGLMHARKYLETPGRGFLVHNVDIISDADLGAFVADSRPEALATLLVSDRKTSRYLLFNDDMRLVGWTNVSTGEVRTPFPGLDVRSCRHLAFSGIHYVSAGIFSEIDRMNSESEASGKGRAFGDCFPIMDFYIRAAAACPIYGKEMKGLHIADVGTVQSLHEIESVLKPARPDCPGAV